MSFPTSMACVETQRRRPKGPDADLCAQLAPLDLFGPGAAGVAVALFGRAPLGRGQTGPGGR